MTSRVTLVAAATPVWPQEPPHFPEAPPAPLWTLVPKEGAGHCRECKSVAGNSFAGQQQKEGRQPSRCGDSQAGKRNRRKACKEMKECPVLARLKM